MPRTITPEEQERASDITGLKSIKPTPNRKVHVDSDADGEPNMFYWDPSGEASNADGVTIIESNVSSYGNGGSNEGVWRRLQLPFSAATTDNLSEGSNNLYFSDTKMGNTFGSAGDVSLKEQSRILTSGLTAQWTFDDADLNSGTVVDITGNGNDGETRGGVTTGVTDTPSDLGEAFSFDGNDDYVPIHYELNGVNAINQMTAAAWVRVPSNGGDWSVLDFDRNEYFNFVAGNNSGGSTGAGDFVGFNTNSSSGSGVDDWTGNVNIRDGNWHHIAVVFDSSATNDKKIYVDGQIDSERNAYSGAPLGSGKTRYGIIGDGSESGSFDSGQNSFFFEGDIADLRFYKGRALSGSEIEELSNSGSGVRESNQLVLNVADLAASDVFGDVTTDDIPEGDFIEYFTDGRAQDGVGSIIENGTGPTTTNYDSAAPSITVGTTDEGIQDAILSNTLSGTQNLISVSYDDTNNELGFSVPSDLSQFSFANVTTDSVSEGSSNLYFTGTRTQNEIQVGGDITQNTGADPFEIGKGSYSSKSLGVSTNIVDPAGIDFNNDGSRAYIAGYGDGDVHEYSLSTAYDISTGSFSNSFSVGSSGVTDVSIGDSGSKVFVSFDSSSDIREFSLSTAYDLSTVSSTPTNTFETNNETTSPYSIEFNGDGTKMFVLGQGEFQIFEYNLSTGFDLSTVSYSGNSFDVSSEADFPYGFRISEDGTEKGLVSRAQFFDGFEDGSASDDWTINDSTLSIQTSPVFEGTYAYGNYNGSSTSVIPAAIEQSFDTGYLPTSATWYYIETSNQTGSALYFINSNGDVEFAAGTQNPQYTVWDQDSGFSGGNSFDGTASYQNWQKVFVTFNWGNGTYDIQFTEQGGTGSGSLSGRNMTNGLDVATIAFGARPNGATTLSNLRTNSGNAVDCNWDSITVQGIGDSKVYKYDLGTAYDITSAQFANESLNISSETGAPQGMSVGDNGTKMYIGSSSDETVYQYSIGTQDLFQVSLDLSGLSASDLFGSKTTDSLPEGSNSFYFTEERAQDTVASVLSGVNGFNIVYDDAAPSITIDADGAGVDVSDDGTSVVQNASDINFGIGVTAIDGGTGSADVSLDERFGSTTFSGDGSTTQFNIAHGLSSEPQSVQVQPTTDDASTLSHVFTDSTNITLVYDNPPPSGTDNVKVNYKLKI